MQTKICTVWSFKFAFVVMEIQITGVSTYQQFFNWQINFEFCCKIIKKIKNNYSHQYRMYVPCQKVFFPRGENEKIFFLLVVVESGQKITVFRLCGVRKKSFYPMQTKHDFGSFESKNKYCRRSKVLKQIFFSLI